MLLDPGEPNGWTQKADSWLPEASACPRLGGSGWKRLGFLLGVTTCPEVYCDHRCTILCMGIRLCALHECTERPVTFLSIKLL